MAVLSNSKHEQFAQLVAKGLNATKAYVSAGYSDKGAKQSASRMLTDADLCSRIRELQETLATGTIALEISSRNARVQALQDRWSMLRADLASLKAERAAAMADVPGGKTGLIVRQYQCGALALPVYKVDTGLLSLLSELRAIEKQAAEELGQWREKREPTTNGAAPLTSITVQFVDSPSMAAARESAKLLAPAAEPK
jgi:hypothetical protein